MGRILYERNEHTPYEVASDPEAFADTYAELCGIIAIDELVRLYQKTFPELSITYEAMRQAAAMRMVAWNGTARTWNHDGIEYALAAALSDAGHAEWFFYYLKHNYEGNYTEYYNDNLSQELESEANYRAELVHAHNHHSVKELSVEQLAEGHPALIEKSSGVQRLIDALTDIRIQRPDHPRKENERPYIAHHVHRHASIASTRIQPDSNPAYEDAAFLMIYTYKPGPRDYDPFRDEPDEHVLLATEVAYRELPIWGLNGRSQSEVRAEQLARPRSSGTTPNPLTTN